MVANALLAVAMMMGVVPVAQDPPLTAAGLQGFFDEAGLIASSQKLAHDDVVKMRGAAPEWFPVDVFDEMDAAMSSINIVTVALPFYSHCFSGREVGWILKAGVTEAGKTMILTDDVDEATIGDEMGKALSETNLTPEERSVAIVRLNPSRLMAVGACTETARAEFEAKLSSLQEAVIKAALKKNEKKIKDAEKAWTKSHPNGL